MIDWNDEETRAELITILAAFQAASQTSQQATQQAQTSSQGTQKSATETVMEDVGGGERLTAKGVTDDGILFLNQKTAYDAYLQLGIATGYQYLTHNAALQNAALIALTNSIETGNLKVKDVLESANMVGKQAIRHGDLAIKHQWEDCEEAK